MAERQKQRDEETDDWYHCHVRMSSDRKKPNILITGTPGTGKTSTGDMVAKATQMKLLELSDMVKELKLHDGYDEEYKCWIIDEDKVCDELEPLMQEGGNVLCYHGRLACASLLVSAYLRA